VCVCVCASPPVWVDQCLCPCVSVCICRLRGCLCHRPSVITHCVVAPVIHFGFVTKYLGKRAYVGARFKAELAITDGSENPGNLTVRGGDGDNLGDARVCVCVCVSYACVRVCMCVCRRDCSTFQAPRLCLSHAHTREPFACVGIVRMCVVSICLSFCFFCCFLCRFTTGRQCRREYTCLCLMTSRPASSSGCDLAVEFTTHRENVLVLIEKKETTQERRRRTE